MNAATINAASFTLTEQPTATPVAATIGYNPTTNTATLSPDTNLSNDATYTATITTTATDLAGNHLTTDHTWTYTTATTPPDPTSSLGSSGAVGFGDVETGTTVTDSVSYTNNGGSGDPDITITAAAIAGTDSDEFSHDLITPLTLAPGASSTVTITHTPSSTVGNKAANLTLTHNGDNNPTATALTAVTPSATGNIIEADGLVVIEAEDFDTNTPRGGHDWINDNTIAGASGSQLLSNPNIGTLINTGFATTTPETTYNIDFTTTGTYNLWLRGYADTNSDNSVHFGINGTPALHRRPSRNRSLHRRSMDLDQRHPRRRNRHDHHHHSRHLHPQHVDARRRLSHRQNHPHHHTQPRTHRPRTTCQPPRRRHARRGCAVGCVGHAG